MLNIFKAKKISVWFDCLGTMHKFEKTIALNNYISSDIKRDGVISVIAGFEDGHCEAIYPIKWNMASDFKRFVGYFDYFFDGAEIKIVG